MNTGMSPVLRGRSAELDAIGAALDGDAAGEQRILLIDGEAGIGKSRLLAEAAEQATARGFLVAAARGDEMERSRPFGVIADALGCTRTAEDPRRHAIASLLTGRDRATGPVTVSSDPGLRYRVVDALCDLVSALAADQPVLLALDDLQWSDQATLVSLTNICQATVGLPVAVLGGHQPIARTSPLAGTIAALDDAGAHHLSLAPLDDTAVHQVVADLLGAEPEPSLLDAVAGATGNPLFVIELIQSILGGPDRGARHTAARAQRRDRARFGPPGDPASAQHPARGHAGHVAVRGAAGRDVLTPGAGRGDRPWCR